MKVQIRRPQVEDLEEIRHLFSVTIKNNFREEGILDTLEHEAEQEVKNLIGTLQKDFESNGTDEYFLIATFENKIVGTIAFGKPNSLITQNVTADFSQIPEIKCVYVLPSYHQQGIGSLLFQEIQKVLTQQKITQFCLDCGYRKSQGFWKYKLGNPTVILANYWSSGSHHLIWMCKNQTEREKYLSSLPKKRVGSGALFLNEQNEILLLQPTYKDTYEIPGGVVEENESPIEACQREIKEELGLDIVITKPLVIEYQKQEYDDCFMFIFEGGILTQEQINQIQLPLEEIKSFGFYPLTEVKKLTAQRLYNRIKSAFNAIKEKRTIYLESEI